MIGILGGTGPEGRGLALRFALADRPVIVGSRDAARAKDAARWIADRTHGASVHSGLNEDAAEKADTVFVAVPYSAQAQTLRPLRAPLAGKIVVTTVVPLRFQRGRVGVRSLDSGSAALEAKYALPDSRVVAAFQTISAHDLLDPTRHLDSDVIVCSDDHGARCAVAALAEEIPGIRAVDGGSLDNAVYVEHITALLLNVNRIYDARAAIRITGI